MHGQNHIKFSNYIFSIQTYWYTKIARNGKHHFSEIFVILRSSCRVNDTFVRLGCEAANDRRFGTICRSHFQWLSSPRTLLDPWDMGPTGCPETSTRIYQFTLRNIPEQQVSSELFAVTDYGHLSSLCVFSTVDCSLYSSNVTAVQYWTPDITPGAVLVISVESRCNTSVPLSKSSDFIARIEDS